MRSGILESTHRTLTGGELRTPKILDIKYNLTLHNDRDSGSDIDCAGKERKKKTKAALDESIRAYACLENYVAFRSPEGAEFIDCVHKVFLEYGHKENIDDLLKRVKVKLFSSN